MMENKLIPLYLQNKLAALNIKSIAEINHLGVLKVYRWLKINYPQLTYKVLYDLHCLVCDLPLNSLDTLQKNNLLLKYKTMLATYPALRAKLINRYLMEAETQAKIALGNNEVPIGAIVVYNNQIIGAGYNQTIGKCNIMQHAELNAITQAQQYLDNYRLYNCDLYVTIEPCVMCCGAIINSRIKRGIYGAVE
ncbi:MAG: nucleoside deaminase, partial [Burkholderiales bacterium]|nr:nucleoside deaminase [Burkholderiales bacterium]